MNSERNRPNMYSPQELRQKSLERMRNRELYNLDKISHIDNNHSISQVKLSILNSLSKKLEEKK